MEVNSRNAPGRTIGRNSLVPLYLAIVAACNVLAMLAFPGLDPKSGAAPAPVPRKIQATQKEIDGLYEDLGHADEGTRQLAYDRLLKIGPRSLVRDLPAGSFYSYPRDTGRVPPARRILCCPRGAGGDPNKIRLVFLLIDAIQKKHGIQPAGYDGLEFRPIGDQVWLIPPPGGETKIELGVQITNVGNTAVRFCLLGLGTPELRCGDGSVVERGEWGKAMSPPDSFTPLLKPGDTHFAMQRSVKLHRSGDGKELWIEGGACKYDSMFSLKGLKSGRYYVSYRCWGQFGKEGYSKPKDGSPAWVGDLYTLCLHVDIR